MMEIPLLIYDDDDNNNGGLGDPSETRRTQFQHHSSSDNSDDNNNNNNNQQQQFADLFPNKRRHESSTLKSVLDALLRDDNSRNENLWIDQQKWQQFGKLETLNNDTAMGQLHRMSPMALFMAPPLSSPNDPFHHFVFQSSPFLDSMIHSFPIYKEYHGRLGLKLKRLRPIETICHRHDKSKRNFLIRLPLARNKNRQEAVQPTWVLPPVRDGTGDCCYQTTVIDLSSKTERLPISIGYLRQVLQEAIGSECEDLKNQLLSLESSSSSSFLPNEQQRGSSSWNDNQDNQHNNGLLLHQLGLQGPVVQASFRTHNVFDSLMIRLMTGKSLYLTWGQDVFPSSTISHVKNLIHQKEPNLPPNQQRLIYAGMPLHDERSLSHYNIQKASVLHQVVPLRGGMYHISSSRYDLEAVTRGEDEKVQVRLLLPDDRIRQDVFVNPYKSVEDELSPVVQREMRIRRLQEELEHLEQQQQHEQNQESPRSSSKKRRTQQSSHCC